MNGYPLDMGALLLALKQALMAEASIPYLRDVRIVNGPFYAEPWGPYTVYLRPAGSPETVVAYDGGSGYTKFAQHVVAIELAMIVLDPFADASVIGRTNGKVGITEFVNDVLELLENNTLGLTSDILDHGAPPLIEFPADAYGALEVDTDIWLQTARGVYRAQTRPYYRTGTYS